VGVRRPGLGKAGATSRPRPPREQAQKTLFIEGATDVLEWIQHGVPGHFLWLLHPGQDRTEKVGGGHRRRKVSAGGLNQFGRVLSGPIPYAGAPAVNYHRNNPKEFGKRLALAAGCNHY